MRISVIIPAHNETKQIASTIDASMKASHRICEVIVVDDCSSDDTSQKARASGALVLSMPQRAGKGAALMRGALESIGDILVFLDADIGKTALEIPKLIEPVATDKADMTIARFSRAPCTQPKSPGLVKAAAYWGVRRLCKSSLSSTLSGQRAARRHTFVGLMPFAPGFGVEVGLTIDALRQNLRILEVDCEMAHRVTGNDLAGISHRARQFYHVVKAVVERCVK